MANQIDVKIEGVEKAIAALKKWQIVKRQACEDVLKEVGFKIEATAKAGCPVDTGRLRASITTNWSGSGMSRAQIKNPCTKPQNPTKPDDSLAQPNGEKGLVVVVGTNVEYGPAIEHGHVAATKGGESFYGLGGVSVGTTVEGRPYLYPAYFSHEREVETRIATILKKDEQL